MLTSARHGGAATTRQAVQAPAPLPRRALATPACQKAHHTGRLRASVASPPAAAHCPQQPQLEADAQHDQQQQQQQQPLPPLQQEPGRSMVADCGAHHLVSRRQQLALAGSAALLLQLSGAAAGPPAARAAAQAGPGGTCALQDSPVGLRWCDVTVGEGQLPIKGAFTKINYTAKLASSGVVFDSTYQRRQPLIFKVGEHEVIEAFDVAILGDEGIPPMREGGRRLVVAAPGPMQRQGVKSLTWVTGLLDALEEAGEALSPDGGFNSVLEFEIELLAKRRG